MVGSFVSADNRKEEEKEEKRDKSWKKEKKICLESLDS